MLILLIGVASLFTLNSSRSQYTLSILTQLQSVFTFDSIYIETRQQILHLIIHYLCRVRETVEVFRAWKILQRRSKTALFSLAFWSKETTATCQSSGQISLMSSLFQNATLSVCFNMDRRIRAHYLCLSIHLMNFDYMQNESIYQGFFGSIDRMYCTSK